ncbi:hypothetical protein LI291_02010 [Intestinibacillus massiliensis]|nr:hypothetical protein [Intestinibacillus massiliensis]
MGQIKALQKGMIGMKKWWFIPVALSLLAAGGCTLGRPDVGGMRQNTAVREEISAWPDNKYTRSILPPGSGSPDYALSDETAGYYAAFFDNITLEQGKAYIADLEGDGFQKIAGSQNKAAIGEMLQKGHVSVNISASENVLGIYITLQNE